MLNIKSLRETVNKQYFKPELKTVLKYQEALKNNQEAKDYLSKERGLADETIAHFRLGYSDEYDAISIPVFKDGMLINIKYRRLKPNGAKYLGEKGAETWIYNDVGIQDGLKHGKILIVEGEFDLMSSWQVGIKNVISPAAGKDSYGVWLELVDNIPKVYIAYDNDSAGREASLKMSERIGVDKSFEVKYPDPIKDANEYFKTHAVDDFKKLIKEARPYYTHQFKDMGDIIKSLRESEDDSLKIDLIPQVEMGSDWLIVVSGKQNVGKTSYVLNVADQLAEKNIPTLIMPFERGIETVGRRYLQVKFDKTMAQFRDAADEEWNEMIGECLDTPIYFSLPKKDEIISTIVKSRRLFDTRFVIIDHLDYVIRHTQKSKESEIADTLQELKRLGEDNGIIIMVVTHIRKIEGAGSMLKRTPNIEDLKGSASLYQDPECVIMLTDSEEALKVDVVKNKGAMGNREFVFNKDTGRLSGIYGDF